MFGKSDDDQQVTMGEPTVQNPSMLDNVSAQDFTATPADPASSAPASAQPFSSFNDPTTAPAAATTTSTTTAEPDVKPVMTTDNPFAATDQIDSQPIQSMQPATPTAVLDTTSSASDTLPPSSDSPSAPVEPPAAPATEDTDSDEHQVGADEAEHTSASTDDITAAPIDTERLASMKQQALEHLEPLVEHLSQDPEEEFRTTMMMIQANDNHTLLEKALEAAKKIDDDKTRAKALLDIINEINYFSQNAIDK